MESDEDDRYGPPSHTCIHCSRCFLARWIDTSEGEKLIVDLCRNSDQAALAAQEGCQFFQHILYSRWPVKEYNSLQLSIQRRTGPEHWGDVCSHLEGTTFYARYDLDVENLRRTSGYAAASWEDRDSGNVLVLYLAREQAPPNQWFGGLQTPPNLEPLSKTAKKLMRTWLHGCATYHRALSTPRADSSHPTMPKRLLHLKPGDKNVYLMRPEFPREYALLSYCWGVDQKTKTTKANLPFQEGGILIDSLPHSIQDAIRVTELLGIACLWVDALCIVQDDPDELAQEIANQAKTYQNGAVTILAGGARDCEAGFLRPRTRQYPRYSLAVKLPEGETINLIVDVQPDVRTGKGLGIFQPDPVDMRAWIFQEVLLSPHVLYFSPTQVMYYCRRSIHIDGGIPDYVFPYRSPKSGLLSSVYSNGAINPFDAWNQLVQKYCTLELSKPHDKLLAISAVAETMEKVCLNVGTTSCPSNYKAGLWQQHMPLSLLWRISDAYSRGVASNGSIKPRPSYRAPSWSWASVDDEVTFPEYSELSSYHPACYMARVEECETQLTSQIAPYGQVVGGFLRLTGFIRKVDHYIVNGGSITLWDYSLSHHFDLSLDAFESDMVRNHVLNPDFGVYILCIVRWPCTLEEIEYKSRRVALKAHESRVRHNLLARTSTKHSFMGLILRKRQSGDVFSRIGCLIKDDYTPSMQQAQRWQDSFERREITIV